MQLVLASQSKARRQLLSVLQLPFTVKAADVDETPLAGETANDLVARLCQLKAETVAAQYPDAVVIGADEVGSVDDLILGKPKDSEHALEQLTAMSGREVTFLTGLCVLNTATGNSEQRVIPYYVQFKPFNAELAERYLQRIQPYHCAASFQVEGLGISLCQHMRGENPSSLIGLPLMILTELLADHGFTV